MATRRTQFDEDDEFDVDVDVVVVDVDVNIDVNVDVDVSIRRSSFDSIYFQRTYFYRAMCTDLPDQYYNSCQNLLILSLNSKWPSFFDDHLLLSRDHQKKKL